MGNSKISPVNGSLINVLEGVRWLLSLVSGSNRDAPAGVVKVTDLGEGWCFLSHEGEVRVL